MDNPGDRNRIASWYKFAAVVLVAFMVAPLASANPNVPPAPHKLGESYVFLKFLDNEISMRLEIPLIELNEILELGIGDPLTADRAEVDTHMVKIREYVLDHFSLSHAGSPLQLNYTEYDFRHIEKANYVLIFMDADAGSIPEAIEVTFDPFFDELPRHKSLLVVEENFRTGTFDNGEIPALVFSPSTRTQTLDLSDASMWKGFVSFVRSGVHHIWIGIDHILFLLALVLPSVVRREEKIWEARDSFKDAFIYVIKIVTLFTIAHSVTLALASLEIVTLPSRLVESVIAASVIIAAVDILYPVLGKRIMLVVFAFGLFHGFGFASNLTHIGLSGTQLVLALIGFNVGVEIGQVGIICVAFPVLFAIRRTWLYRRVLLPGGAAVFVLVAGLWLFERAFDLNVPVRAVAKSLLGAG